MSDVNLTLQDNGGVYLAITETPAVVTLSQAVISGALASTVTVANTVTVALDANSLSALENVTVTVGSAVSVSGTVTANGVGIDTFNPSTRYPIPLNDSGEAVIVDVRGGYGQTNVPISGTVTANLSADSFVNAVITNNANGDPLNVLICNGNGGIESNNPLFIAGTVTANVSGATVTVGNSVTIGFLPAISGTVTANLSSVPTHGVTIAAGTAQIGSVTASISGTVPVSGTFYQATQPVSLASLPSLAAGTAQIGSVTASISGTVPVSGTFYQATQPVSLASLPSLSAGTAQIGSVTASISGTVPVSGTFWQATQPVSGTVTANINGTVPVSGTFWQATQPVSGTVTAAVASTTVTVSAMPSGTLTTRFGTPTTANTAFLTSAVTNTARKYLLIQNVTTGSNVITVGVGFVPTTTQGIQLAAGAGITFESSYIPTGAVWILSSVTASNHTILEA